MRSIEKLACPSHDSLQQLVLGELPESESDTIEMHLQSCPDCRRTLDRLSESDVLDEWRETREQDVDSFPFLEKAARAGDLGTLDHYAIEAVIGRGGSGVVFRAIDLELGRPVAVKVLAFDLHHRARERFLRESRSAARMTGDHVVTVFATGMTIDNRPYLVMPLVEGESLRNRLLRGLPQPQESARLIRDAARGLATIHASATIHRDVKPANILIDAENGRAKLTDFGLARAIGDETLTQTSVLCGTPEYMSPEQAQSSSDPTVESDIYALGITLYECLADTPPFRGQPLQILEQHRQTEPIRPSRLNPETPRDLETICLKAISKSPSRRYPSAMAMAEDLDRYLDGRPILARETTRGERLRMWCGRNPMLATLTTVSLGLLLLLAAGSMFYAIQTSQANNVILEKQARVEEAEQRAVQDRTAAVESLDRLVDSLYDDLSKNAATIKTREKVVNAVIAGLNSLTRIQGDKSSDRTALKAYSRIAELYSLQGSTKEAEQAFQSSIKIARSLADTQTDDPNMQRDLAKTLDQLAVHYARSANFAPMLEIKNEVGLILSQLLTRNPNDLGALRQLVLSHARDLDYLWQNSTPEESLKQTRSAIEDVDRLLELENDNSENYRLANQLHSRLGRAWLENGNLQQAEIEFDLARERIDRAAELAGSNPDIQLLSAVTSRMRGVLLNALGKQKESLKSFGLARTSFQSLADADPDDKTLQQNIANTLLLTAGPEQAIGQIENAIASNQQAIDIYDELLKSTDQKIMLRSLLVQAHTTLADLQLRMRSWEEAIVSATSLVELIEGDENNPPLNNPGMEYSRRLAEMTSRSATHMLDPTTRLETPEEIAAALFQIASMEAVDHEKNELSGTALDQLKNVDPKINVSSFTDLVERLNSIASELPAYQTAVDFNAARIWSLRAKTLAESPIGENSAELAAKNQTVADCTIRAVEHLTTFTKNFPGYAFEIYREPDFIWLRTTPEFQSSNLVMPGADTGEPAEPTSTTDNNRSPNSG